MSQEAGKVIYNILSNDANVSGEVGTKIYPVVKGQGFAFPAIVYDVVAQTPTNSKDGPSTKDRAFVNIKCLVDNEPAEGLAAASPPAEYAASIAGMVRTAVDGQSGTYNGVVVKDIRFENMKQTFHIESKVHEVEQDFMVVFSR